MTHLDAERLGEAIDARLDSAGLAHLEVCSTCRTQLAELRAVLQQVTAIEEPAPSPLFWEHFRTRVARTIDEPRSTRTSWLGGQGYRWLTAASAVATIVLVTLTLSLEPKPANMPVAIDGTVAVVPGTPAAATAPLTADTDAVDPGDTDQAWALVRSLAEDLDYDAAHDAGVAPAPGALERAALELSAAERTALIRLLEQEMKRTDS